MTWLNVNSNYGWLQERPLDFGGIFHNIHFFLWEYFKIINLKKKKSEKYV